MKKTVALLVFVLVLTMASCQSNQPSSNSEMQSKIDELRTQLENNQRDLETANSKIKELQDEIKKRTNSSIRRQQSNQVQVKQGLMSKILHRIRTVQKKTQINPAYQSLTLAV